MEPPNLDFVGSGLDFPGFWTSETMPEGFSLVANTLPPTCLTSLGHSRAKSGRDLAEPQGVCLECRCFRVMAAMGENPRSGRAAVSPPWGLSIRRPPKVCQWRAGLISYWLCRITAGQSQHSFEQFDLKCFFPCSNLTHHRY